MIRDKIPNVQDVVGEFTDSFEKDNDCAQKNKGKINADKKRGAKDIDIQVLERKGNIVKVSGGGRILLRDVSHLKRIPGARTTMDIPSPATDLEKPDQRPPVESPGERDTSSGPGIKLKLINKGGMWEPVREGVESDALSHTGTDQSSPIGDRADERQWL
ncbi:hypothetical protein ACLKA6_013509 [Drosophila palustris]